MKNHKLLFATGLTFCNNPKASGKISWALCGGNQSDVNFRVDRQKYVIPAALN